MHITLRPNEKIYINGAVLRVDRKTSLELLNDAVFLLEAHVMTERAATTPLRRLYFIVQLMLIEPQNIEPKRLAFNMQGLTVASLYHDDEIQTGLTSVRSLVERGRAFEALKVIRSLLPREDSLVANGAAPSPAQPPPSDARVIKPAAGRRALAVTPRHQPLAVAG